MTTQQQSTARPFSVNSLIILMMFVFVLNACKKDDSSTGTGGAGGTGSSYSLTAPPCLITSVSSSSFDGTYTYDSAKRLIKNAQNHDSDVTEYSYQGNLIIENNIRKNPDGTIDKETTTHYLNGSGLIEKSIPTQQDPNQTASQTFYYYNTGYLMREIHVSTYKSPYDSSVQNSYYGSSYAYENGNRTKEYSLRMDQQGNVVDSTLQMTMVYDLNLPGKLEAWAAWTQRTGRASSNDVKTYTSSSGNTQSYTYTIGSNGCPSLVHITGDGTSYDFSLVWNCQ